MITKERAKKLMEDYDEGRSIGPTIAVGRRALITVIALHEQVERLTEALIWCSGSADFGEGGIAREGWLKLCAPLLKETDHD